MEKERTQKSLGKLEKHIERSGWVKEKYPEIFSLAEQYAKDAGHFFEREDYFSAFGASDYAYGLLYAVWMVEKGEIAPPLRSAKGRAVSSQTAVSTGTFLDISSVDVSWQQGPRMRASCPGARVSVSARSY